MKKEELLALIADPNNKLEAVKMPRGSNTAKYNLVKPNGDVFVLTMLKSIKQCSITTKDGEIDMPDADKLEILTQARNTYVARAGDQMLRDRAARADELSGILHVGPGKPRE